MSKSYVTHLECSITGKKYEANKIHGLSVTNMIQHVNYFPLTPTLIYPMDIHVLHVS